MPNPPAQRCYIRSRRRKVRSRQLTQNAIVVCRLSRPVIDASLYIWLWHSSICRHIHTIFALVFTVGLCQVL